MSDFQIIKKVNNATPMDLVRWFLVKESLSQKKIQKLAYYAQAWSLVFLNQDIVEGIQFQAWVHGPVNYDIRINLVQAGWSEISLVEGKYNEDEIRNKFTKEQNEVLEVVWNTYGKFTADQLETLTHRELPWLEQRNGLTSLQASQNIISNETMKNFYKELIIE